MHNISVCTLYRITMYTRHCYIYKPCLMCTCCDFCPIMAIIIIIIIIIVCVCFSFLALYTLKREIHPHILRSDYYF